MMHPVYLQSHESSIPQFGQGELGPRWWQKGDESGVYDVKEEKWMLLCDETDKRAGKLVEKDLVDISRAFYGIINGRRAIQYAAWCSSQEAPEPCGT